MKGLKYYLRAQGIAMSSYATYFIYKGPRLHETYKQTLWRLAGDLTMIVLWPAYLYKRWKD